ASELRTWGSAPPRQLAPWQRTTVSPCQIGLPAIGSPAGVATRASRPDLQSRGRRARAARSMPPVISRVNVSVFTNQLTPPTGLGLIASPRDAFLLRSGSA